MRTFPHLLDAASRPLPLRRRPDLVVQPRSVQPRSVQGRSDWVVKDPTGFTFFRFNEQEMYLLNLLDGSATMSSIRESFETRFPCERISIRGLWEFIARLHSEGLLISERPGQGSELLDRHRKQLHRDRLRKWSNVLAFRVGGIDPSRVLDWISPKVRWCFHPLTILFSAAFIASAVLLVVVQFDRFCAQLPEFHQFFSPTGAMFLATAVIVSKVIHEFGHGVTCRHFGGECHDMGILFLVLTPCFYCDVSDAWMMRNRWKRIAIAAAGICVELVLAALATFLWWFSQPGALHHFCLSMMLTCSVSTILFNANPLLRFDAYYILTDVMETPNLMQKSQALLQRSAAQWFLGITSPSDSLMPERNHGAFITYAALAWCYRWIVTVAILGFLFFAFRPFGLVILSRMVVTFSLCGILIAPAVRFVRFLRTPGSTDQMKSSNLRRTGIFSLFVGAGLFLVPFPHHIYSTFEIRPDAAQSLYAVSDGVLHSLHCRAGDIVQESQPLLELSSPELETRIGRLATQREELNAQRHAFLRQTSVDFESGQQLAAVEKALGGIREQVNHAQHELAQLSVTAVRSGVVVGPAMPEVQPNRTEHQLPSRTTNLLDSASLGCAVRKGDLLCAIGTPGQHEAVVMIRQEDTEFVREGARVLLCCHGDETRYIVSCIERVSENRVTLISPALSSQVGGSIPTTTDGAGHQQPTDSWYPATVPLKSSGPPFQTGLTGRAKISAGSRTMASRIWRFLSGTFRLEG